MSETNKEAVLQYLRRMEHQARRIGEDAIRAENHDFINRWFAVVGALEALHEDIEQDKHLIGYSDE